MKVLKDYSGKFRPNIRYEDLSKEVLAKLLKVYCQEMLLLDWYWYTKISEKLGEDEAFKVSADNWCQIGDPEMRWTMEALNIKGNDVAAYAKTIQFVPSFAQDVYKYEWDLKNNDLGVLTVYDCPALTRLEQQNPEKIPDVCQWLELEAMKKYAKVVNPAIQIRALKTPPRQSPDEIACQWEFSVEK